MNADVSIRDVAARNFVGVTESDAVDGASRLMRADDTSCAVVLRGSDPVGIVTERDVVDLVANGADPSATAVREIMSEPVVTMDAEESLAHAAERMGTETIRHLVVTDGEEVFGVLAANDILTARAVESPPGGGTPSGDPSTGELIENGGMDVVDDRDAESTEATYDPQSICEKCGALTDSLTETNGQLVCENCQEV